MDYKNIISQLNPQEKFLFEKILYYHDKISYKNRSLKRLSYFFKISVFVLAGSTTVILGIDSEGFQILAKNIAIILGATITLFSAILSYLNIEQFWMRNITNHLKINKLRDNFIFKFTSENGLSQNDVQLLFAELSSITQHNINYWEELISETNTNQ